jgi:DNA-directed RNA polymerase subunit RPC12/RpoP
VDSAAPTRSEHYRDIASDIRALVVRLKDSETRDELISLAAAYERLAEYTAALVEPGGCQTMQSKFSAITLNALSIEPMKADELRIGETYDSWVCEFCRSVIALAPRTPDSDPLDLPDAVIGIKCPHCNSQRHYTVHERRVRQYPWGARSALNS